MTIVNEIYKTSDVYGDKVGISPKHDIRIDSSYIALFCDSLPFCINLQMLYIRFIPSVMNFTFFIVHFADGGDAAISPSVHSVLPTCNLPRGGPRRP